MISVWIFKNETTATSILTTPIWTLWALEVPPNPLWRMLHTHVHMEKSKKDNIFSIFTFFLLLLFITVDPAKNKCVCFSPHSIDGLLEQENPLEIPSVRDICIRHIWYHVGSKTDKLFYAYLKEFEAQGICGLGWGMSCIRRSGIGLYIKVCRERIITISFKFVENVILVWQSAIFVSNAGIW